MTRKTDGRGAFVDAQSFDDRDLLGDFRDSLRSFVAVELCSGQAQGLRECDDRLSRPVHEDAHRRYERRQFAQDVARGERRDRSRTFGIKVQADGVSAKFCGETRIRRGSDATNFYADHSSSLLEAGQAVTEDRREFARPISRLLLLC